VAALVSSSAGTPELWVYDLDRRTETRVITRGAPQIPRWWPDGRRIVFTEIATRVPYHQVVVRQLVESAGERDTLAVGWQLSDISPDTLAAAGSPGFGDGAWIVPLVSGRDPEHLDSFPTAWGAAYSPDQRWIAYTSNEAGRYDIYVTDAARRAVRRKVSLAAGEEPVWSRRGDELFYRWGQQWFVVAVPPPGSTTFGRPRAIFRGPYVNVLGRSHDIAPDGRHLLILGPGEQSTTRLNVITNWADAVRRKVEP
jgi:Tol biopolymer transport system component